VFIQKEREGKIPTRSLFSLKRNIKMGDEWRPTRAKMVVKQPRTRLFLFSVGIELLEKCDQVVGLLLILQTNIDHLGARDFRFRVLDVLAEGGLIPSDSGVLVGG
jgi:hypothetical protein